MKMEYLARMFGVVALLLLFGCCRRAQWEIQLMAKEMLRQARSAAPMLFAKAGPGCLDGPCPEGPMTCGAITEVRQEYSEI